jgi:pimeloyl-ACP methyl ester carboxylesterase
VSLGITLVPLPTHRAALAGGDLAYLDVGPPAPVATAVFVPGYTGSKEDFALLAAPIAEGGVRFVAIDQRGQFESVGPDEEAAYRVPALAGELLEFVASLGAGPGAGPSAGPGAGPVHVVGHSFGGLVARAAAIRAPEAFASLTLLDSGPAGLTGPRVDRMQALEPLLHTHGPEALFEAILGRAPGTPDDELTAFLRRRFLASSLTALRVMGQEVTDEPDRVAELRATGLPFLVACGEQDDAWTPETQRDMAERLGAPFAVIAGAIHSPAAERPAETARALLDFWRAAPSSARAGSVPRPSSAPSSARAGSAPGPSSARGPGPADGPGR